MLDRHLEGQFLALAVVVLLLLASARPVRGTPEGWLSCNEEVCYSLLAASSLLAGRARSYHSGTQDTCS